MGSIYFSFSVKCEYYHWRVNGARDASPTNFLNLEMGKPGANETLFVVGTSGCVLFLILVWNGSHTNCCKSFRIICGWGVLPRLRLCKPGANEAQFMLGTKLVMKIICTLFRMNHDMFLCFCWKENVYFKRLNFRFKNLRSLRKCSIKGRTEHALHWIETMHLRPSRNLTKMLQWKLRT